MNIISIEGRLPNGIGITRAALKAAATGFAAASSARIGMPFREVVVHLQDDESSDAAHRAVLGVEGATDVITQGYDAIPPEEPGIYGELFVNAERAMTAAPHRRGWSAAKELLLYVAHGMDHLSGADDGTDADYARMRRRELGWLSKVGTLAAAAVVLLTMSVGAATPERFEARAGTSLFCGENLRNFTLTAKVRCSTDAEARMMFHTDLSLKGYQVLFKNGPIDGSRKTGSLSHVRNLYRSLAKDGEWFRFSLSVRERNIEIDVGGVTVVRYTEPDKPYRTAANARQLLSRGDIAFFGVNGLVAFRDVRVTPLLDGVTNPKDNMPPVDEQVDRAIRKQQIDFPVIDFHVHLKGGLTKEMAHEMSMNYGINYGLAPNVGEGGVGRMLRSDAEAREYLAEVMPMPFLCGVQGEGRKWPYEFSKAELLNFDYMFTDSMTVVDGGFPLRIYRKEEYRLNGRTEEQWMDYLVDQIEKILENEPVDQYANATYLPPPMDNEYEKYWTDARVQRVLDVLVRHGIALEISARYRIPSARVIKMAKARGVKFTFGTNNGNADFGRLEYALDMVDECGLTAADVWFPTMSRRARRDFVPYNTFNPSVAPKSK